MTKDDNLFIKNMSKRKTPSLPFHVVKDQILGKDYEMSLVFTTKSNALKLNMAYRQKDYVPNILSFPYTKKSGDIFIHLATAQKQYKDFDMDFIDYILFLFIHGCLHLKGSEHSSTMEKEEMRLLKKFKKISSF